MKFKKKILTGILAVSMVCIILQPNKSNAALQSNGGTPAKKSFGEWIVEIRQMQELGGTLGRTDTINTTNLTSKATDLDIHMEKNTEYGAMAILSASAYGNPNPIADGETTTGNSTGIVMKINNEWVAVKGGYNTTFDKVNNRYTHRYDERSIHSYVGDAMVDTNGWHSSSNSPWFPNGSGGMLRAASGGIFSHYTHGGLNAGFGNGWSSRACIVVGTGI